MSKVMLILFCLGPVMIYAQRYELGLRGGANFDYSSIQIATSGGSFSEVSDTRTGFLFGAYTEIKAGLISIQPEVYYSVQGTDVTLDGVKGAIKTNYLQVPILAKLNFLRFFNVHLGPQYGILLSSNSDIGGVVSDLKSQTKSGDFSVLAGIGIKLPARLHANLRYVKGYTEMVDGVRDTGLQSLKNAMLQVTVGYAFVGR